MEGGGEVAPVMDPIDSSVLYGVGGGVQKTVDGGERPSPIGKEQS
jgi:hypothetical protein